MHGIEITILEAFAFLTAGIGLVLTIALFALNVALKVKQDTQPEPETIIVDGHGYFSRSNDDSTRS